MMKLAILILGIKLAVLASFCEAEIPVDIVQYPHAGWDCGHGQAAHSVVANAPAVWSSDNDKICKKACKKDGSYPTYELGNWALFEDTGLECCCAIRNIPFMSSHRRYWPTMPYLPYELGKKMNIDPKPLRLEYTAKLN